MTPVTLLTVKAAYILRLRRSPTNAWYPIGSGTCISNSFKSMLIITAIFGIITLHSNIWEELLSWMGFMNGIFQWATIIVILVFLLNLYSSTFRLIMHQSIWIPWGWIVIPGDSYKALTYYIEYWHQYFRTFFK